MSRKHGTIEQLDGINDTLDARKEAFGKEYAWYPPWKKRRVFPPSSFRKFSGGSPVLLMKNIELSIHIM